MYSRSMSLFCDACTSCTLVNDVNLRVPVGALTGVFSSEVVGRISSSAQDFHHVSLKSLKKEESDILTWS